MGLSLDSGIWRGIGLVCVNNNNYFVFLHGIEKRMMVNIYLVVNAAYECILLSKCPLRPIYTLPHVRSRTRRLILDYCPQSRTLIVPLPYLFHHINHLLSSGNTNKNQEVLTNQFSPPHASHPHKPLHHPVAS